ncbi:hypothetical protein [Streptomyces fractus]|uniref:hypothetical protein n=1 Tax=Streptomyces fractus TaxID=641806 RepID=UPI003CF592D6
MRYLDVSTHLDADTTVRVVAFPHASSGRPFVSLYIQGPDNRIALMVTPDNADALRALAHAASEAADTLDALAPDHTAEVAR